jgi:Vitamin K epoxide reductase family
MPTSPGMQGAMTSRTRGAILIFALGGLVVSIWATTLHHRLLVDPSYVSPCDIDARFNCSQVYLSAYGSIHGVPVAPGGVIWFGQSAASVRRWWTGFSPTSRRALQQLPAKRGSGAPGSTFRPARRDVDHGRVSISRTEVTRGTNLAAVAVPDIVALLERVAIDAAVVIARPVARVVVMIASAVATGGGRVGSPAVPSIVAALIPSVPIAAVVGLVVHAARLDRIVVGHPAGACGRADPHDGGEQCGLQKSM